MKICSLVQTSSANLLPPDTYIYSIVHVTSLPPLALAILSSDDTLRLLDRETLQQKHVVHGVHEGVTAICTNDSSDGLIFTAGRDGEVRGWDFRIGGAGQKAIEMAGVGGSSPILSLAISENGPFIAAGTEYTQLKGKEGDASVLIWDYRSSSAPLVRYSESHNDDITVLAYHPTSPSTLLSGSTDSLINIYNTSIHDEDDAVSQVINHGASIAHAGFLPSTNEIWALSHDEAFGIYPLEEEADAETVGTRRGGSRSETLFGDLRQILGCEYIIDILSANGKQQGGDMVVAAGSHSPQTQQNLNLIPLSLSLPPSSPTTNPNPKPPPWTLNPSSALHLPGAHGSEIVRSLTIIPFGSCGDFGQRRRGRRRIYTAGEDGLVRAWEIDEDEEDDDDFEMKEEEDKGAGNPHLADDFGMGGEDHDDEEDEDDEEAKEEHEGDASRGPGTGKRKQTKTKTNRGKQGKRFAPY